MQQPKPDQLTEAGEHYTYRDGEWTTNTGYCVSTSYGHALTLKFYEQHGRSPACEPTAATPRGRSVKSTKARAPVARTAAASARTSSIPRGRSKAKRTNRALGD